MKNVIAGLCALLLLGCCPAPTEYQRMWTQIRDGEARLDALEAKVDLIDKAQDEWHTVKIPEGIAVVHSGKDVFLQGHNHLDPLVTFGCPTCEQLLQGALWALNTARAQQQRAAQQSMRGITPDSAPAPEAAPKVEAEDE